MNAATHLPTRRRVVPRGGVGSLRCLPEQIKHNRNETRTSNWRRAERESGGSLPGLCCSAGVHLRWHLHFIEQCLDRVYICGFS